MNNQFKLSIISNYGKSIKIIILLFISLILPIIFFSIVLEKELLNPSRIRVEFIIFGYIIIAGITILLYSRKASFSDTISLTDRFIDIPKINNINYNDIAKYRVQNTKGFSSLVITQKSGRKIAFSPTNNFSESSEKAFRDFINEFEKKANN